MASQRPVFDPNRIAPPAAPSAGPRLLTVSQLNRLIQQTLAERFPSTLHLVGEISNFSRQSSGHLYLTLKDDAAEIRAVMWKSAAASLKFKPADGLEVVASGRVDVYEPRGQYQFYISRLEPRGVGALELAFRQLCEKLSKEGLFDPGRKRPIPRYPRVIAVVTSPTGAAIRDILHTIRRRYCCASVLLHPVRVQGEGAADDVAAAIARLNRHREALGGIDVMIVGRGGGSLEDLWAFNEESVARAISASGIPIISAVGHEVDTTVADLVADLRAPTPTAAAELACPVLDEVLDSLADCDRRLRHAVRLHLAHARRDLTGIERIEWFRDPCGVLRRAEQQIDEILARLQYVCVRRLAGFRERLHRDHVALTSIQPTHLLQRRRDDLASAARRLRWALLAAAQKIGRHLDRVRQRLVAASPRPRLALENQRLAQGLRHLQHLAGHLLELDRRHLASVATRLEASSHRATLARGFTITRLKRGRQIISGPTQVRTGDLIITETATGEIESRVQDRNQLELFD